MVYTSDEIKEASFAILEDGALKKLVFKKVDDEYLEVDLSTAAVPDGTYIETAPLGGGIDVFANSKYINGATGWIAQVFGVDADNSRLFFKDGTGGGFGQSDNWGDTQLNGMGLPPNVLFSTISGVVQFDGFIYAIYRDITTAQYGVYRAAASPAGTVLSWSAQVLTLPASVNTMATNLCLTAGSQYLYVAEYGDPTGGPSIWRSSDGTTWTKVHGPISGTRHIHAIKEDPYNPGHIWATLGDTGAVSVIRSTDHGDTWTSVVDTTLLYQAVQISFSENWVWFAADRVGLSVWVMDRATLTPRMACKNWHVHTPVPGGVAGRIVTDGGTTASSGTLTSATAAFTADDVGKLVSGGSLPAGSRITAFTNATTVTVAPVPTVTASGVKVTISGDLFRFQVVNGAVDPDTEIFYFLSSDASAGGTKTGLFYLEQVGGRAELLDMTDLSARGGIGGVMFIGGGYLFSAAGKHKLLARA